MENDGSLRVIYEARRGARGGEAPVRPRRRRRVFIASGAAVAATAAAAIGGYLWWQGGRVRTVRATVSAAFVSLSAHVDARVRELAVRRGQHVMKGQVLLQLDDSEAQAALTAAEAARAVAASRYVQAEATARRTQDRIQAEIELSRAGVEIAQARVAGTQATLSCRKAQLPEEIRQAQAERDEAKARLDRLKAGPRPEEIETAKVKLATAKALAEFAALELRQAEGLAADGVESRNAVLTRQAQLAAQEGLVREAELTLARLQAGPSPEEIEAVQQTFAAREAALALAVAGGPREVEALTAELDVRQAEFRQAEADLRRAEATRLDITLADEQVRAAAADLQRAEAEVAGRRAALAAMTITSPVEGTVIHAFHRPGETCKKGDPSVVVADDSAGRWVEGFVGEADAVRVQAGQRAVVDLATGSSVEATVDAVALATSSLGRPAAVEPPGRNPSEMVWVKFRFVEPHNALRPGTSAYAVIHVRGRKPAPVSDQQAARQ